jgi:PAS domain S-box-containing protein
MDALWLEAPAPAVKLWREAGALRWRLNRAALEWSLDAGRKDADWRDLAARLALASSEAREGRVRFASETIQWTAIKAADWILVWLTPESIDGGDEGGGWGRLTDKLELIQDFGRMGLFERDLRSGEGRWDKYMFRLFAIEPVLDTPPFDAAIERVHPEDRQRFLDSHREYTAGVGRYENRYRLLLPDGQVRDIHSLVETQQGTDGRPATMLGVLLDDTDSSNRVRAQQALSAKLSRALELAGVVLFRQDLGSPTVHLNDVGYRSLGHPVDMDGIDAGVLRSAVHPEDLARIDQAAAAARSRQDAVDVITRYRSAGGGYLHLLTRLVAERDERGEVVAVSGVALDQTAEVAERERAQALRRSIELVADAAGVGLWSVDVESSRVEWNTQMLRIYGLPDDHATPTLAEWLGTLIHPDDRARVAQRRRAARESGERTFDVDFRVLRPGGEQRWVVCRSSRETREGRAMFVGLHLDVTERRATEAALARQQERLAVATEAAGMGVWERDAHGRIVFWDDQMFRLRGRERDPNRDLHAQAMATLGTEDREMLDHMAVAALERDEPYEAEFRIVWPDGSERWLLTVGKALRDPQGRPLGMVGINVDVTQRRRAEQALRDRDAAERASRSKSEFLARMSHELRTPLNAVLGFAQLIEHDGADSLSPAQLERVSRIRTAGQHLLSLISDVLDLSAVEAGTLPLSVEPVALDLAFEEVRQWVAGQAERNRVSLQFEPSGLWVLGDRRRLRQVLANLITNAVKYNRPGGHVWLRVRHTGAACEIEIRDDGRGLSEQQLAHLFEPFNRLGAEREGIEGVGLGLMIVRHLVEYMGGRIDVESRIGAGTTMRVTLAVAAPGSEEEPVASPPEVAQAADGAVRLRILYVEDNPVNLLLVEELVALRPGMQLTTAPDGASGVEAALAQRPDMVLVDMQLPDIDGFEVLRRLRAEPILARTTVVALSANAMPDDVARARQAGFDDYWTKPIDFKRFLDGLDAIAARHRAPALAR